MSMDFDMGAVPADEAETPSESEAETNYARACAALELASGSPEAMASAATEFHVSLQKDDSALVTIGDVEVSVSAEQIDTEVPSALAEIESAEPLDGAA